MARVSFPYYSIFIRRNNNKPPFIEPENESRAYRRVGNGFEPIGWYVQWSDGKKEVIFDTEL